jgi:hypothetical protein
MKKIFSLFLILLASISISAQDTMHVVTYYKEGKLNEKYVCNSKKEKDGEYVRYSRFGKTLISGQYSKGQPVGIWQYYSSDSTGVLVQKLDFDSHKELFLDPLRMPQLICGPRYFGGNMLKVEYVKNRTQKDFTDEEKKEHEGQTYTVSFTIDSVSLKPIGITVDDPKLPEPFKNKLIAIVAEMPTWLPPECEGKSAVWRFSVAIAF